MESQAKRMRKLAAQKQGEKGELTIGDVVYLRKEEVDRGKLDSSCATMVVLARIPGKNLNYVVGNKAGVYKEYVARPYLTPAPQVTPELVGLHEILAAYQDPVRREKLKHVGIRAIAASEAISGKC